MTFVEQQILDLIGQNSVSNVLPSGQIVLGNLSNVATPVTITGVIAIDNTGKTTINKFSSDIVLTENFIQNATGSVIQLTAGTGGGGSNVLITNESQNNWNGATAYGRLGVSSVIITTGSNSRSSLYTTASLSFLANTTFSVGAERAIAGGQIDFANDPVLQGVGLMGDWTIANPVIGVYHRAPRTGETAFLKYVVRTASTEVVASTSIAYDATASRYIKTLITWNGSSLEFKATDGTTTSTNTIATFLTTYPAFIGVNLSQGATNNRNGAPVVGVARTLKVDKVFRYIQSPL